MANFCALNVPDEMFVHWQATVDLIADIAGIPAALIMLAHHDRIEVFTASKNSDNPYRQNEMAHLGTGLYCETVIKKNGALLVPNALADSDWDHNPDIKLGMISYFGLPLCWPDGKPFGTICMLDSQENNFSIRYQQLLTRFKESIESDLKTLHQQHELIEANQTLEQRVKNRTADLKQLNSKLTIEISHRNRIEEELKDSQFFFKESQRAAFIGSYRSDFVVDTWKTSEVCDQIFGIDNNYNKCIQGWSELVNADDIEFMTKYFSEEGIGKNRPFNKEYRRSRRSDGETRWLHGIGETISDEKGTCTGLIGTIQDITIRKEAELTLIAEQDLLSTLIDTLPDLVWLKNTKRRLSSLY